MPAYLPREWRDLTYFSRKSATVEARPVDTRWSQPNVEKVVNFARVVEIWTAPE